MRPTLVGVAVVTLAAIAACSSSTEPSNCDASTTSAAYHDELSVSATVTSITSTGTSRLIGASESTGEIRFIVDDTTPVFVRVGDRAPKASSACRLAVGEVVDIPLGSGFGDFTDSLPASRVGQVVIHG